MKVSRVCIWGAGLSGYTLARAFAEKARVRSLLIDIDQDKVRRIGDGAMPFGYPVSFLSEPSVTCSALIAASSEPRDALSEELAVHMICVPTEANGTISKAALIAVVSTLAEGSRARPLYVVIESTVAPSWVDDVYDIFEARGWRRGVDLHLGASARRDVFGDESRSLGRVSKVFGGDTPSMIALMRDLYGPIWPELHQATDAKEAMLVKVVENMMRYSAVTLANLVAASYTGFDVANVLRLAATKWNMPLYYPGLGVAGYCIPVAKDYVADSALPDDRSYFDLLGASEAGLTQRAMTAVARWTTGRDVAILGLAYAPELKIHVRSPSLTLCEHLRTRSRSVAVHDPLYSADELSALTGAKAFDLSDLAEFDTIVLMTAHRSYLASQMPKVDTSRAVTIIDNGGHWRDRKFPSNVIYRQVGGRDFY